MKSSIEKITSVHYKLTIQASTENISQLINKKLIEIQKKAKVDGFRVGKVPFNIIKKKYESAVYPECVEDLINDSYQSALEKEKIIPISSPKIEILSEMPLKDSLEFTAEFDVYPTVKLFDFKKINLDLIAYKSSEEDLDNQLNDILKRNLNYEPTDEKAANSDSLDVTYQLIVKGKPEFEKPQDLKVVIGSNSMIPGFEDKMIGLKKGDKTQFNLTFPKDYSHQSLQNENVEFQIEVKEVKKEIETKLDDDFAQKMGAKDLIDLKENLRKNLSNQAKSFVNNHNRKIISETIIEKNDFEIPGSIIHREQHHLFDAKKKELESQKTPTLDLKIGDFKKQAHDRVKISILFQQIIEDFELKNDESRFDAKINEMVDQYGGAMKFEDIKKFYTDNPDQKKSIQSACMEDAIFDLIQSQSNTTIQELNFEQIIQKGRE